MKILFYGDVVGKLGRAGVKLSLPEWQKKYSPDFVIANIENILHGKGIGRTQIDELKDAGVDIFTGGNHSLEGKNFADVLNDPTLNITRPANMSPELPGRGFVLVEKNGFKILILNLIGQVHMRQQYDSPFHKIDAMLESQTESTPVKIVDWHADATSEKIVMGWYLDGKVSAVLGTHTHVPTNDERVLPKGTAYISDVGMVGPHDSIIGVDIATSLVRFKNQIFAPMDVVETGPIEINAVYLEIDESGKAVKIEHLRKIIETYTI